MAAVGGSKRYFVERLILVIWVRTERFSVLQRGAKRALFAVVLHAEMVVFRLKKNHALSNEEFQGVYEVQCKTKSNSTKPTSSGSQMCEVRMAKLSDATTHYLDERPLNGYESC